MDREAHIGIFDSGVGGLTVAKAVAQCLPSENLLYLGDTARVPYGNRRPDTIVRYARGCCQLLMSRGIKALVIACNTASAYAVDVLRGEYPELPILGVIEPVASLAAAGTKRGCVGVIGTRATVASEAYVRRFESLNREIEVIQQACPLFVPLVEEGWLDDPVTEAVIERYLHRFEDSGIDSLVLGCTHYPMLAARIQAYLKRVGLACELFDSGQAVGLELQRLLAERGLLSEARERGRLTCLVTDDPVQFGRMAQRFGLSSCESITHVDLVG